MEKAKREQIFPASAGIVAAIVYSLTMSPTVTYGGDCGELVAAAHVLGIAHPPGYPLYMSFLHFLGKILPGEPALAGNLFSCLSGGLAVALLCASSMALGASPEASALAALSFGFSHLFWGQAVIAEVYALHLALFGLLLLSSANASLRADLRWLCVALLTFGLGIAHHLSLPVVSLPLVFWVLLSCLKRRGRRAFLALPFALFGLLFYLYLPLCSGAEVAWAEVRSLHGLLAYFTFYKGRFLALPPGEVLRRVGIGFGLLPLQFLLFTLAGLRGALTAPFRGAVVALVGTTAWTLLLLSNYDVGDIYNFFLPAYAAFVPLIGLGLTVKGGGRATFGVSFVGATIVAYQASLVFPFSNMRGNTRARDYAVAVLSSLPRGSSALAGCDEVAFSMLYVQNALGLRPDVKIESCPSVSNLRLTEPEEALREGRPVYVLFFDQHLFERHRAEAWKFGWRLLPEGPPAFSRLGNLGLGRPLLLDILDKKAKRGECLPAKVRTATPIQPRWAIIFGVREGAEREVASGRTKKRALFSLSPPEVFFAQATPIGKGGEAPIWLPDGLLPGAYKIGSLRVEGNPFVALSTVWAEPWKALSTIEGRYERRLTVSAN